jgi:uncharacterized protein (DUF302 family)
MSLKITTVAVATALLLSTPAFAGDTKFDGNRVTVASAKSFEGVVESLKALVAKNGMMVMAEVNQGQMLSMTGMSLKATLFLVGNPTVGKQIFEHDHGAGLYIPLRIFVYTDAAGKTFIAYGKPSSLLGQFKNDLRAARAGRVAVVGRALRPGRRRGLSGQPSGAGARRGPVRPRLRLAFRRHGAHRAPRVRRSARIAAPIAHHGARG